MMRGTEPDRIVVDDRVPGVQVVTESLPWCRSVAVGVWIDRGSADEGPGEHGAAHFLEHVLFRRTRTRTGREISEAVDELGGDLNAFTGREHTCYHVQVPAAGLGPAVDLLADVVVEGRCEAPDVALERDVVLDELAARADDPEDLALDLVTESVLGDDPLGRPIIGSERSVAALGPAELAAVHRRFLSGGRIVVAAAGDLDHDALIDRIGSGPLGTLGPRRAVSGGRPGGSWASASEVRVLDEDSEQAHLVLGRRTPARDHPDRAPAQIAAAVLGGGVSSRLFQHVREELGLAYSVYAAIEQFGPVGVLSVVAGCAADRFAELHDRLGGVVSALETDPPTDAEVARAVGHLTGSIELALDDPMARMSRIGRHLLERGEVVPVAASLDRLRAVDAAAVARHWRSETSPWCLTAVGPGIRPPRRVLGRGGGRRGR